MAIPGKTIGEQLAHLEHVYPHRAANGHLYANAKDKNKPAKSSNLYLYMESSDGTFTVHETAFPNRQEPMTPKQWAEFYRRHAFKGQKKEGKPYEILGIIRGAIIPGMNLKTNLQWRLKSFLGFTTFDIQKPVHAEVRAKRHKAKSSGKSNGQTHIRRGHRNRKRKTK